MYTCNRNKFEKCSSDTIIAFGTDLNLASFYPLVGALQAIFVEAIEGSRFEGGWQYGMNEDAIKSHSVSFSKTMPMSMPKYECIVDRGRAAALCPIRKHKHRVYSPISKSPKKTAPTH